MSMMRNGAGVRRERLWGQAGRGKVLGKDQAKRQPCEGVWGRHHHLPTARVDDLCEGEVSKTRLADSTE